MNGSLIVTADRFFHVSEINGTKETEHANYLATTTLKSPHGPMSVHAVFHDVDKVDPNKGRFFFERTTAWKLFNAVQGDISQYDNPLINGETLEQAQEWLANLSALDYQRRVHPHKYYETVVYREYAGVQVVGERNSFALLELLDEKEDLPVYEANHDDYFCIRVDLTEHQDEDVIAFLYVKDRDKLVAVMEELLDTWINVEVVVSNVERLKALMGLPHEED
jgi:hypothetical protein